MVRSLESNFWVQFYKIDNTEDWLMIEPGFCGGLFPHPSSTPFGLTLAQVMKNFV
jgi:hypothetical protein